MLHALRSALVLLATSAALTACGGGGSPPAPAPATSSPTVAPASSSPTVAPATSSPTPAPTQTPTATPTQTPTPTPTPAATTTASGFTITGTAVPQYAKLDAQMQAFMQTNGIRAGQLAVGRAGTVVFSHAYTNTTDPSFAIVQPTSIMRVASNSKAFATAAITKLFAAGTVTPQTRVYPFLGITAPLIATQSPDPNANAITVQELIDHTAGFHNSDGSAPEFNMYAVERAAGLSGPLTRLQFAQYLYGQPLYSVPGTQDVYSNEDYFLLARVVEKAVGEDYKTWVDANVLAPIGVSDDVVTATAASGRLPNEVPCDDPGTGPSVLFPQQDVVVPDCYGGSLVYEVLDGSTSISISAQSLVKYLGRYNAYGLGPRAPGYAREGSLFGSLSWMEALTDGNDFAFSFNDRVDRNGNEFDISPLTRYFEANI